jgi:Ca-activated chloride channel family protein
MRISAVLDVDMVALGNDDTVTAMVDLAAPPATTSQTPRREQTVVVVVDRSGSMSGPRLSHAIDATVRLVDRLDDDDRFGLVSFDHQARVVVPAGRLGDLGRDKVRGVVRALSPGGSTDLSSGYLRGLQEARRVATETGATLVLLSDGHANVGETDPERLAGVARQAHHVGVTTSTIGIGLGYDETILAAMADAGTGNHTFAEEADAAGAALAGEVEGLLSKTVQAASLRITPTGEVSGVHVFNQLPATAQNGELVLELGDFYSGETRRILFSLRVPRLTELGLAEVARLEIVFVALPQLDQRTVTLPVSVNVVPGDEAAGRVAKPEVEHERLYLEAQQAKREAKSSMRRGDFEGARASMRRTSQSIARHAAESELLAQEAGWFEDSIAAMDRDPDYLHRRITSDSLRKSRGHRSRSQGGEHRGHDRRRGSRDGSTSGH